MSENIIRNLLNGFNRASRTLPFLNYFWIFFPIILIAFAIKNLGTTIENFSNIVFLVIIIVVVVQVILNSKGKSLKEAIKELFFAILCLLVSYLLYSNFVKKDNTTEVSKSLPTKSIEIINTIYDDTKNDETIDKVLVRLIINGKKNDSTFSNSIGKFHFILPDSNLISNKVEFEFSHANYQSLTLYIDTLNLDSFGPIKLKLK